MRGRQKNIGVVETEELLHELARRFNELERKVQDIERKVEN